MAVLRFGESGLAVILYADEMETSGGSDAGTVKSSLKKEAYEG
jgi:hypothetical protein